MALIAIAADKGSPGVTTTAVALAAVWPRPVLLAECDPAGGDLVYRLPGTDGERLDPRRGLLSLAVAARRGLRPHQVWEHVQKLRGGLDVLTGVTSAEHGAGLEGLWGSVGAVLSALPQADVIVDCGRIGVDGPYYDLLAQAAAVVMISRATLGEVVRLRERAVAVSAALQRRGRPGARIGVVVIADHKHFNSALAEVAQSLDQRKAPASVIGGLADEPKSADLLRGEWGGKLDKSLLIRTAREIAAQLAAQLPAEPGHQQARPPQLPPEPAGPRLAPMEPRLAPTDPGLASTDPRLVPMEPRPAPRRGLAIMDDHPAAETRAPAAASPQVAPPAPAGPVSVPPAPVGSAPVPPAPVLPAPGPPSPVGPGPARSEPVSSEPAVRPGHMRPELVRSELERTELTWPEPPRLKPVRPEVEWPWPSRSEPVHSEAAWPEPPRSESARADSAWPYPDPGGWPDPDPGTGPLPAEPSPRGRHSGSPGPGGDA
jgi:hypothetical protein